MDTALHVGLSRQMVLQRALDVAANNLANVDTVGFKVEELMTATETLNAPRVPRSQPVNYVLDRGVARNFGQGSLDQTSNPLDVAIEGDAFFAVTTPNGVRYTRDGRFTVDPQGRLTTKRGDPVGDITLDPQKSAPAIGKDGVVTQSDAAGQSVQVGKLQVVRFADLSKLSKEGANLYAAAPDAVASTASDAVIRQGTVERSNVTPVTEVTNLIAITRAYERVSSMLMSTEELSSRAVERLGRVS